MKTNINIRFEGNKELIAKAMPYTDPVNPPLTDEQNLKNYFYDQLGKALEMNLPITEIDVLLKTTSETGSDFACQIIVMENNKALFEYITNGSNHAGAIRECVREVLDNLRKLKDKNHSHKQTGLKDIE